MLAKAGPVLRITVPLLLLASCVYFYTHSGLYYTREVVRKFRNQKEVFVEDFLDHDFGDPFDGSGIRDLCDKQVWDPNVIFGCAPPAGGIVVVRNSVLTCIRLAMASGASLILPEIAPRSKSDISKINPHSKGDVRGEPLSYFFDVEYLESTLSTYCPQMKIYRSMSDLYLLPSTLEPLKFSVNDVMKPDGLGRDGVIKDPTTWPEKFNAHLNTTAPKRDGPLRTYLVTTSFLWPIQTDSASFYRHFSRILRLRHDVRRLASSTLYRISEAFDIPVDLRQSRQTAGFTGIHLRTEKDAIDNKFPPYVEQAANYLDFLAHEQSKVVFVATGDKNQYIESFIQRASDFGASAFTKEMMLEGDDLQQLQQMTWDQRGLVDWEVLLRSDKAAGTSSSAFAWSLALWRSYALTTGPGNMSAAHGNIQWDDGFTTVYGGSPKSSWAETMWP